MDKNLNIQLNELINKKNFHQAEIIIENILKNEPQNTELWLIYAKMELTIPLVDFIKSMECLNQILEYDKTNFEAILLLCCIKHFWLGGVDDELMAKLDSIKTNDKEKLSMIEYVKSWYYDIKEDNKMYEQVLLKSIELFSGHVFNYKALGQFYIKHGRIKEGKELIKLALKNVQFIYSKDSDFANYDHINLNQYFNQLVKGTYISLVVYESIKENLLIND